MVKPSYGKMIPKEGIKMRFKEFIFLLILTFIIGAIIYEVVSETVIKPVKQIQQEYNYMMDELFNSLVP